MSRAGRPRGYVCSPETRAKMRAGHVGRKYSPEALAKRRGWKHTPEGRAKISAGCLGKKKSPETRAKMGAAKRITWDIDMLSALESGLAHHTPLRKLADHIGVAVSTMVCKAREIGLSP